MSGEINVYYCKELLNKLTTTPIKVKIQCKEYQMYYHQGTLSNHQHM